MSEGLTKTKERTSEQGVTKHAPEAFKDHVLTLRSHPDDYAKVWMCAKPGTSCYHFKIVTWPGYLSIHGDCGDLTVSRECDMISWARGAVKSPSYFFEKATLSKRKMEQWENALFEEWLQDQIDQDKAAVDDEEYEYLKWSDENVIRAREAVYDDSSRPEDALYEFLSEIGLEDCGEDVSCCFGFDSNSWWCLEAVKKFLELYDASLKKEE